MPPSPEVMFLVGYSENIAKVPNAPTGVPFRAAPWAWAASSNRRRPCASAMACNWSIFAGWPYRCTGMIAFVRSVIAASTEAGSRVKSSSAMSAKTGVAPVSATEFAVAAKVNEGTMTSSPAPMPLDNRPRCRPEVPEFTATQARPSPKCAENSASNAATSGPWAIMPERSTRSTASRSSSPMIGLAGGMNALLIESP